MLELKKKNLIGKGLHRECYVHPDDESRCIKVVVLRGEEETKREQVYYKLLQKKAVKWIHLPQFYGNVETSLGPGAVFDLIRDNDGTVSKTLEYYFESSTLTQQHQAPLQVALQQLKADLLEQNIISMTLKPKNMTYQLQADNSGRCIIIDNIGNGAFIPIASYLPYFGHKKIARRWQRFIELIQKDYAANVPLQQLTKAL